MAHDEQDEPEFTTEDELAHNAGVPTEHFEFRGEEYPLAPLTIAGTIKMEDELGDLAMQANTQRGIVFQLRLAMIRGGMDPEEVTVDELAEEIPAFRVTDIVAKLNRLHPSDEDEDPLGLRRGGEAGSGHVSSGG